MFIFKRLTCLVILVILISCGRNKPAAILLFNGTGTSPNDVKAIAEILDHEHLDYTTVNSSELNQMSRRQLMAHRLLIMPGGDFINMGKSLDKTTTANINYMVHHGLNYLGICAGAFLAGKGVSGYYKGIDLTSGVTFGFYTDKNEYIRKKAVAINYPNGPTLDQYWEDGPQLSGWGETVAKYPNNTPAVAEGKCGNGFVILAGIHPEAPEYWCGEMAFHTSVADDNAYAAKLIRSALNAKALPHY